MEAAENKTDILVIGGGVVGLMIAVEMLHRGKSVRLIDKNFTGQTRTHVGELAFFGGDPVLESLTTQSRQSWLDASSRYGEDFGVMVRGALELANTKGRVVVAQTEAQNGTGVEFIDDKMAIEEKLGASISDEVKGAKWDSTAPIISTHTVMEVLQRLVNAKGGIVWGTDEVVELLMSDTEGESRLKGVRVKSGDVAYADEIIVAAGAMTHLLLDTLELKLPLRPARQHLVTYHVREEVGFAMLTHRMRRGHVMMKRLREGPLMLAYDGLMDPMQATYSLQPDEGMMELLQVYLGGMVPALKTATELDTRVVTGAVTPDFRPVIGRWPGVRGLWVITGLGGRNYAYAAIIAQTIGQSLANENLLVNLTPFAPDRFELDRWPRFQRPPSLAWNEQATFSGKAKFATTVNTTGSGPAEFMNNVQMTGGKSVVQMGGTGETRVRERTKGKVQMGGVKTR